MRLSLKKLPMQAQVGVVGGGVSGLFFTYFLGQLRPDLKITLFEGNSQHIGGYINSWHGKDNAGKPIMLERGPRTLRGVSDGTVVIVDTLLRNGHGNKVKCIEKSNIANRKFLLDPNDKLVQAPESLKTFYQFLKTPLSKGILSGCFLEIFRKRPKNLNNNDESITSLMRRRYGNDYVGKNLLSAIFRGIYADDIDSLSAQKITPKMYNAEKKHGSIMKASIIDVCKKFKQKKSEKDQLTPVLKDYCNKLNRNADDILKLKDKLKQYPMLAFDDGLGTVPLTIKALLTSMPNVEIVWDKVNSVKQLDDKLHITTTKGSKKTVDHLRIATTPNNIVEVVKDSNQKLSDKLKKLTYNTVSLINFYLPDKDLINPQYHSFGYLVPKSNKNPEKVLGVIFDSIIEQNLKPTFTTDDVKVKDSETKSKNYTKLTVMIGGYLFNNPDGIPVVPSKETIIKDTKEILKRHLNIPEEELERGIWQYTVANNSIPHYGLNYLQWAEKMENELKTNYQDKMSIGGMAFARSPGVPDVVVDAMMDAIKLSS